MPILSLNEQLSLASSENMRQALILLLAPHHTTVFGAAKTVEHEVAAINALKVLRCLPEEPDEYDLIEILRVTKAKARALLYQAALRTPRTDEDNKSKLRKILSSSKLMHDGKYFVVEVPDPLLVEDLRRRVRRAGSVSDATFSSGLVRLPEIALVDLLIDLFPESERDEVEKSWVSAGYQPKNLKAVVGRFVKSLIGKAVGEAGGQAMGVIGEEIGRFFIEGIKGLK